MIRSSFNNYFYESIRSLLKLLLGGVPLQLKLLPLPTTATHTVSNLPNSFSTILYLFSFPYKLLNLIINFWFYQKPNQMAFQLYSRSIRAKLFNHNRYAPSLSYMHHHNDTDDYNKTQINEFKNRNFSSYRGGV